MKMPLVLAHIRPFFPHGGGLLTILVLGALVAFITLVITTSARDKNK